MQLTRPTADPTISPMFRGNELRMVLEARTASAVAAVQRLELKDWDKEPPAPAIAAKYDVTVPAPDWDGGHVTISQTLDQRMRAVWSWTVAGDVNLLTSRPASQLIGGPTADVGLVGQSVVSAVTNWTLSAAQIDRAASDARYYVDRYLVFIGEQVDRWRFTHTARVRDAAIARKVLLDNIAALEGVY